MDRSRAMDIDPLADLTWMIERLHSNAARTALQVATQVSVPLSTPRPPVALSHWAQPCGAGPGFDATSRFNDHVNNDVELRWKCTKPRSGLDKAGSTKSNISSYGTVMSGQGPLNWFVPGAEASCPPLTAANRPRAQDECPVYGDDLPPKRRRRATAAVQGPYVSLQYMDKPSELSGQQKVNMSPESGTFAKLSSRSVWSAGQTTNRTARRTDDQT